MELHERVLQMRGTSLLMLVTGSQTPILPPLSPFDFIPVEARSSAQAGEEVVFRKDRAGGVVDADECLDPHHLGELLFAHP